MDTKVLILSSFHRFVPTEEGKPERREAFSAGQTVTVSEEDAADWVAKDLAKPVVDSRGYSDSETVSA